jgi:hypothetical protein
MSHGIEMSSLGGAKSDFNTVVGNVSTGHVTSALTWGAGQRSQRAAANLGDGGKQHVAFTFVAGATSRVMPHALGATPARVYGTPRSALGSATRWWVGSCSQLNCVVNLDRDPGTNVDFNFELSYGDE